MTKSRRSALLFMVLIFGVSVSSGCTRPAEPTEVIDFMHIPLADGADLEVIAEGLASRLPDSDEEGLVEPDSIGSLAASNGNHIFRRNKYGGVDGKDWATVSISFWARGGENYVVSASCSESRPEFAPDYWSPLMLECVEIPFAASTPDIRERLRNEPGPLTIIHEGTRWSKRGKPASDNGGGILDITVAPVTTLSTSASNIETIIITPTNGQ